MNICGIYKYTSPNGKVYIGSSINILKRIKYYKSLNCKGQIKLYNSFLKYGYDNHIFEILEECDIENLYEKERYYGELFNVLSNKGLNLILPKNGEIKNGISEETRLRMSESSRGDKNSFYGKHHSEETKEKIRNAQLGRKHSEEHRMKVSKNNAKNLSKIVLDLNTGVFYNSIKEVAELYNIKHSTLRSRLNGTNKNNTQFICV
jgi:group I intron endonuclease